MNAVFLEVFHAVQAELRDVDKHDYIPFKQPYPTPIHLFSHGWIVFYKCNQYRISILNYL